MGVLLRVEVASKPLLSVFVVKFRLAHAKIQYCPPVKSATVNSYKLNYRSKALLRIIETNASLDV